jgi:hypothetical protein
VLSYFRSGHLDQTGNDPDCQTVAHRIASVRFLLLGFTRDLEIQSRSGTREGSENAKDLHNSHVLLARDAA